MVVVELFGVGGIVSWPWSIVVIVEPSSDRGETKRPWRLVRIIELNNRCGVPYWFTVGQPFSYHEATFAILVSFS